VNRTLARSIRTRLLGLGGDVEAGMDLLREAHQREERRLLERHAAGVMAIDALGHRLSQLADLMLAIALEQAWRSMPGAPARRAPPGIAVIAYGKLGARELTYGSDLDLVFLHGDAQAQDAADFRFVRRLAAWLSAPTARGVLFETDFALRAHGSKGLAVQSLSGFERYQRHDAWVYEHQALTRARFAAGDARVGEAFEALREEILVRERAAEPLAAEIAAMRDRLAKAHRRREGEFDLKYDRGGLLDVEFAVQFLVLANARRFPALARNAGNAALLDLAAQLRLLPAPTAAAAKAAYRNFRSLQQQLRRTGARRNAVPQVMLAAEQRAVRELWDSVFCVPAVPSMQ
jgi:[glutamine synthetase] adenylyltransferase / [glutamine synthetase]-adenylyl-L-tyrosine phosphorylase